MTNKFSYDKSIQEIERIIEELQSDTLGIDELSAKVKKASDLIKKCKTKLVNTRNDVDKLLDEID